MPAHSSPETYAGVDFYTSDKLRMPEYGLCKNLVQNPGFEMGLRYWGIGPLGKHTESKFKEYYLIDDTAAYQGHRCLKILGEAGQSPAHLSTFAIPAVAGQTYTFSFYAKADRPFVYLDSLVQTMQWGMFAVPFKDFQLTTNWQRYSVTFTAPNGVVAADFGLDKPTSDCAAWVDCVQIERGALTDYAEKPYQFGFVTDHRDNLFDSAERTGARIEISGRPMATGTLTVNATGTLGEPVHSSTEKFTLDAAGRAVVLEPWADRSPSGITVVETDISTSDGFHDREFARLTRMRLLRSSYPNRQFFAFGGVDSRISDWDRRFAYYYEIGLGSCIHFDPQPPAYKAIYQKLGILSESSIFDGGDHLLGWNLKDDFLQHLSGDDLAKIEDAAYKKAAANPDITYWKLINEPDGTHAEAPRSLTTDVDQMKKYMTMLAAARRGILRANPHAIILSPDPAGMSEQTGIRWLDTFIKAGGLKVADLIAVHPYRPRPEDPDLDEDTSKLFAMLDRDGYHGDVWYTEGGGTSRMNIPAYGLDVYKTLGADTYRAGSFTYDLGWAEKLSTAYCIRQWLVGLKYHNRLKQYVDWYLSGDSVIDQDGTPGLIAYAPNTLGNLLGDAAYARDIALGNHIRSYLFKDGTQRPVIALWTYDLQGDHGEKTGPTLNTKLLPKGSSAWNMVGDNVNLSSGKLTLGPFPIFLRGPAGTQAQFSHAIESAPMLSGGNRLRIWPQIVSLTQATIMLQNVTRNPVVGEVLITQKGMMQPQAQQIEIAPNKTYALPVVLSPSAGELLADVAFHPADGGGVQVTSFHYQLMRCHQFVKPPTIDGDLSDWPAANGVVVKNLSMDFPPPSQLFANGQKPVPYGGPKDLSATFYTGWDSSNFYIAAHVVDDVFHPAGSANMSYTGDGMQVFFDSWADAASHQDLGFDGDDQGFGIWPGPDGAEVDRTVAPDVQIAFAKTGKVVSAQGAWKRTSNGYNIEIAIPAAELVPLNLKAGTVFGLGAIINDNDGDYRKRGLTLTPAGKEPFGRPDLYPIFVMTK